MTTTRKTPPPSPPVQRLNAVLGKSIDRAEQLIAQGKKAEGLTLIAQVLDILDRANGSVRERMRSMRP